MRRDFKATAVLAARAASDKKAEDIVLYHIRRISGLADFLLLATVDSSAQLEAVEDNIERALKEKGILLVRRDGRASERWRVLDYGGLLIHLMHRDAREFYALDRLYIDARRAAWEAVERRRRTARPRRRSVRGRGGG
jgi:ribosome-associated protein